MKFTASSLTFLAAVGYMLFAAFGVAVWHALLFVAMPKGATAWGTALELVTMEPQAASMQVHAAATLLAAVFAAFLFFRPALGSPVYLVATAVSVGFAPLAWLVFAFELAVLPTASSAALVLAWLGHKRRPRGDA